MTMQSRITNEQLEKFKAAKEAPVPHYTAFYGMSHLLHAVTGIPSPYVKRIHLDHGIILDQKVPDQYLANTTADLIFVDTKVRLGMVSQKSQAYVLGPLFVRYRRKLNFKYNPSAAGTIVFPTHSSHHLEVKMDWEDYAISLKSLPQKYQPITVCMYWLDILKGENKHFEKHGIEVISNGHMFDSNYAFNFYSNLTKFRYASGNEPGSFLFYAIEIGMPFFFFGPNAVLINDGKDMTAPNRLEFNQIEFARQLKQLFRADFDKELKITDSQRTLLRPFIDDREWASLMQIRFAIIALNVKQIQKVMLAKLKQYLRSFKRRLRGVQAIPALSSAQLIDRYVKAGRKPWSQGYEAFKHQQISSMLEPGRLDDFTNLVSAGDYSVGLDERIVEYPWIFQRLALEPKRLLDAGSTFNFEHIVDNSTVKLKELHIFTYFPEERAFWKRRISYAFGDLRLLPYRDSWFDEIVCQSTLEHIGMDNSIYGYTDDGSKLQTEKSYEYLVVICELLRVLNGGGRLLITVPYGKFENQGFFQQFDSEMVQKMIDILQSGARSIEINYFKYEKSGWRLAAAEDCKECVSYNPHTKKGDLGDGAAHSRAICCICFDKI